MAAGIPIRRPEQPGVDAVLHPGASSVDGVDAAQRVKLSTPANSGHAMEASAKQAAGVEDSVGRFFLAWKLKITQS